jgi:hypothetical protein
LGRVTSSRRVRDGGSRHDPRTPESWRMTMPPADVAVTALRRATAPTRRPGGGARPGATGASPLHHDQWAWTPPAGGTHEPA